MKRLFPEIVKIIKRPKKDHYGFTNLWEIADVLVKFNNNSTGKSHINADELYFRLKYDKVIKKYPEIVKDLNELLKLYLEHIHGEENRNQSEY